MGKMTREARLDRRALLGGLISSSAAAALPTSLLGQSRTLPAVLDRTEPIEISARPIADFARGQPQSKRFGALEFRGGLVLTSPSSDFGGWSGLVLDGGGSRLLAISDIGSWLSCNLTYEGGRLTGMTEARIGPLQSLRAQNLRGKREQDAESMTLAEGTLARGTLLIGFERFHRIGRFPVRNGEVLAPAGYLKLPSESRRMANNQGFEALAVLKAGPYKGAAVAFAERLTGGTGYHSGWMWIRGEPKPIGLRDLDEFNITDAAGLPDGGLLVLERFFRWTQGVKMRIRRLMADEIHPGARMTGKTLLEAGAGFEIDNMEGIATHQGRNGETIVTLLSDDNFNRFLQRTIILQFALMED